MSEIPLTLLLLTFLMTGIWLLSLIRRDASIVDRFWGLLFVFIGAIYFFTSQISGLRPAVVFSLVVIWGVRLALHIHLRNRNNGEDVRYQMMRQGHGDRFWWYSFFSVFMLQGVLALLISAPLYCVFLRPQPESIIWSDTVGFALWIVGFAFEVGGDWQLRQFKKNPANRGTLLTTGFWSLSRHPNYFGDACLWWGFYFFALSADNGWGSIFGPILMTYFLRYVSGVTLLEKGLKNTKPGYEAYIENTPAFFPRLWPRKRSL